MKIATERHCLSNQKRYAIAGLLVLAILSSIVLTLWTSFDLNHASSMSQTGLQTVTNQFSTLIPGTNRFGLMIGTPACNPPFGQSCPPSVTLRCLAFPYNLSLVLAAMTALLSLRATWARRKAIIGASTTSLIAALAIPIAGSYWYRGRSSDKLPTLFLIEPDRYIISYGVGYGLLVGFLIATVVLATVGAERNVGVATDSTRPALL